MVVGPLGEKMHFKISNKSIGNSFPTFFIAEAGLNHNGDIDLAKKMIDASSTVGADAIKFQTYKSENFLSENSEYFDFFKNVELSFEEFREIKEYADNQNVIFLSTPFDFESADYLRRINVPGFKIASSDMTNLPLISHIAKMKLPIILSTGLATIGEIDIQFYKILVEKEKLVLTVPINQQSKLRPIATINQINKCVAILKLKPKIKRTMWSRRAQEYDQKINSGKIYELAEVVKDLNKNTDIIADQSYSERQLFEKAYERLKSEFEAVLKVSADEVQKKMDKALGRTNLSESQ